MNFAAQAVAAVRSSSKWKFISGARRKQKHYGSTCVGTISNLGTLVTLSILSNFKWLDGGMGP